jgi:nonsense-mediated mRNA decay protein 3
MENTDKQTTVKQSATIYCCHCGTPFSVSSTGTNICLDCLSKTVDITTGITREGVLERCEGCYRYQRPPWTFAEHESKELMAICLKKIKGLNKVNLIDAKFIWTDPTTKHVKLSLTVQQEVMNNASIQQTFPVEFTITELQCNDCRIEDTHHTWRASVQVRQHADHKKTFLYLEQLIMKKNLDSIMHSIEEAPGGLDFNFKDKANALKLVEFMEGLVPIKLKSSSKHISTNEQVNTHAYKFIFSVEIPKVCQDDLVVLTPKLAGILGGCSKVLLCTKVASVIHFIDLKSMKPIELSGVQYFQHENELQVLPSHGNLSEFMVFDVEALEPKNQNASSVGIHKVKTSRITIGRTSDWTNFEVKTHLGDSLGEGTTVLGYDLSNMNLTGLFEEIVQAGEMPEVVIVKKVYTEEEKKKFWNLHKADFQKDGDKNYDDFLTELEFDPVLRTHMILLDEEEAASKADTTHNEDGNNKIQAESKAAPQKISKKKAEAAKKKQDAFNDKKEEQVNKVEVKVKSDVDDKEVKMKKLVNPFNMDDNEDDEVEDETA